jgi:fructose-1,6-bisphosphatase/inositol monophosphatase family enzyme
MLEVELWENSCIVLDDAKHHLIDDTPEAYARRENGLEEERKHSVSTRADKKGERSIRENLHKMFSDHPERAGKKGKDRKRLKSAEDKKG